LVLSLLLVMFRWYKIWLPNILMLMAYVCSEHTMEQETNILLLFKISFQLCTNSILNLYGGFFLLWNYLSGGFD
jgi:hypothetical protein